MLTFLMLALVPSAGAAWRYRSLKEIYDSYNEAPLFSHWEEYADGYEANFPRPDGVTPLRMLEIGVQSGGSSRVWKQYYGAALTYTGVDINEKTVRSASPSEHISIEIGSQLDAVFLRRVCRTHGPFDIVVDDGGHSAEMMRVTLDVLWSSSAACLQPKVVYAIEDMHTLAACGMGFCDSPRNVTDVVAEAFYGMHAHWFRPNPGSKVAFGPKYALANSLPPHEKPPPAWATQIRSISLYDSLAFFHRNAPREQGLTYLSKGTSVIGYGRGAPTKLFGKKAANYLGKKAAKKAATG